MTKKNWTKGLIAILMGLAVVACSKESGTTAEQEFVDNFNALVMGGKTVDSLQDWSTSSSLPVKISVDMGTTSEYRVYILPSPPVMDGDAAYLGMAKLKSGESKTITIPRSVGDCLLYAACYDSDNHVVCQPFPTKSSGTEVVFSGMSPDTLTYDNTLTGENWSLPVVQFPDLSTYLNGFFFDLTALDGELSGDDLLRLGITSEYTGNVPALGTTKNIVLYVDNRWTLTSNQDLSYGNVLVVGRHGEIVIPEGMAFNAETGNGEKGLICVLPGGKITGEGILNIATGSDTYLYNWGTVTAAQVQLNGASFYNEGVIGDSAAVTTKVIFTADSISCGQLVNRGDIWLKHMSGDGFSLHNAGKVEVTDELTLSNSSRLADGSYTHFNSLVLNGSSDGTRTLYMGNAATLDVDDISIDNFGIWGPSGKNFTNNAILKVNNCSLCNTTEGQAGTYLLDHVELILPSTFDATYDKYDITANCRLLHYFFNAYEGRLVNTANYSWILIDDKDALAWSGGSTCACDDTSRQTCTYSTSPSFKTPWYSKDSYDDPLANCVYYAFETPVNSSKDYDYNDVILRVSVPVDQGDGTYVSNVQLMCVGNTVKTTVLYNGQPFGDEVHAVIGVPETKTANTSSITRYFYKIGELTFTDAYTHIDHLNFTLNVEDSNGKITTLETGTTPLYLIINGANNSSWFWPAEGVNIGVAYPKFSNWASDRHSHLYWYDSTNAVSNKVISWTVSND